MQRFSFVLLIGWLVVPAHAAVTFNKDVAPLVFAHCAGCHRPGQSGPFALLSYADVKKRAKQIAEITAKRYMPPWLPEGAQHEFLGDRRLSNHEIRLFGEWFENGAPEGSAADLPARPDWVEGWQLGQPDLIVKMPKVFRLPAEGRDVYRNFVIPASLGQAKYVRAVEFRPDNPKIVHHAFIKVDSTGHLRGLEGKDGAPGFGGMNLPDGVNMPSGYFLSWQPGKTVAPEPPGFGWMLLPGQDLVLQTHLRPTGKPEELQAEIGLYFTEVPPTNIAMVFVLCSFNIDIPAGTDAYLVRDSFILPLEVDLLAVLPHTHYLGKRLEGIAELADGSTKPLISIPDWDFNWQGDYRYARPVHLPRGTTLRMQYSFDNSTANPRNPNQPPKEVRYGPQSTDEMAELWFQVRLQNTNELSALAEACNEHQAQTFEKYAHFRLEKNPRDAQARTELGFILWKHGQIASAVDAFRTAAADDPSFDQPHYYLGVISRTQKRLADAQTEFLTAIRLNPANSKAFGNLGFVYLALGNIDAAEANLAQALKLNPADDLARSTLQEIRQKRPHSPAQSKN